MTDSDLIERLRSEAEIADRPGQFDRLNAIADEFAAEIKALRAEVDALREEIGRLLDSREREGDRLDWLLARLPGDVIRDLVGEMSCTSDVGEWRDRIDKAARFKPPNP